MNDDFYMKKALALAQKAYDADEVPVGAVVIYNGKVIGRGYNRRETDKNPLAHAELAAIRQASKNRGGWRLIDCTLYVTLEPCPMCAGAIVNARIPRVVFGAHDAKAGACGSVFDLFGLPLNHKPALTQGVMENECGNILKAFFRKLR